MVACATGLVPHRRSAKLCLRNCPQVRSPAGPRRASRNCRSGRKTRRSIQGSAEGQKETPAGHVPAIREDDATWPPLRTALPTLSPSCCCRTPPRAAAALRCVSRISGSGRPGPGPQAMEEVRAFSIGLEALGPRGRRQGRHHRPQPAAALLGDVRGAGARRGAGAGLCRLRRRRDGLRARPRRGARRRGAGPGAGRQGAVGRRPPGPAGAHGLRRAARPARLRSGAPEIVRGRAGGRPRRDRRQARRRRGVGERHRARRGPRPRRHPLHLRHHRPAQGRDAVVRQRHPLRPQRQCVRPARRARGRGGLSAAGVGGRPHLLLRAVVHRGVLRQLPGVGRHRHRGSPRDRADLLLRAAAGVRDAADHDHGAHGGCRRAQAQDVPRLHRPRPALGREAAQRRAGAAVGARALLARRVHGLRPAEEPARHDAAEGRLHRGRGDRPGDLPLLPLARHQLEAALRPDRGGGVRHRPARRRDQVRHRRQALAGGGDQDRRDGRGAVPLAGRVPRLLQGTRQDVRDQDRGRLGAFGRCRLHRCQRASAHHRSRQGRRQARLRRAVRAEIHREQIEVLSHHQGGGGDRPGPRRRHRDGQYRPRRGGQLGRAQLHRLRLLPGARRPSAGL